MIALALTALLSFQDPAGDTVGNGSLVAPTAAVFRNLSSFDLLGVDVLDAPTLQFALMFAALPNPLDLPNGFSLPIIELYVGDATVGSSNLLPGSGMNLPGDATWHYALRLTGDRAQVFVADADTVTELGVPVKDATEVRVPGADVESSSTAEENVVEANPLGTPELGVPEVNVPELGVLVPDAPELTVTDAVITVKTSLPRPESLTLYGLVGSYSPFSDNGWQTLSAAPSPWAFSSADQTVPVVDVLAEDETAQARAIDSQILAGLRRAAPPAAPKANPWLLLVAGGFVVALVGFVGRFTVPKPVFRTGLPPEVYEQAGADAQADAPPSEPDSAAEDEIVTSIPEDAVVAGPFETERLDAEPLAAEPSSPESLEPTVTTPDSEASEGPDSEHANSESADLEAWVASKTPQPEKPVTGHIPVSPETYTPETRPGAAKAVPSLELHEEDWPEPEDTDLWIDGARADERTDATDTLINTDVKHL
ncbi:hypothetical protein BH24DEI2_BH24DEI2_14880 [soil metagenome]